LETENGIVWLCNMQGCQMLCFQTKTPNSGEFWSALERKKLVYSMAIWNIFPRFGTLNKEKSGNLARLSEHKMTFLCLASASLSVRVDLARWVVTSWSVNSCYDGRIPATAAKRGGQEPTLTFAIATARRGLVVIASASNTEDPGFESRLGARFLGR
jgi:hypothetical protein